MDQPDFVQLTIRLVSEQVPTAPSQAQLDAAGQDGSSRRKSKGKQARRASGAIVPESELITAAWDQAFSPDGQIYYWNRLTDDVSWERPAQLGMVGKLPTFPAATSVVNNKLDKSTGSIRAVNYVVFEHSLERQADDWKICAI